MLFGPPLHLENLEEKKEHHSHYLQNMNPYRLLDFLQ